jgi:hypothetical protein
MAIRDMVARRSNFDETKDFIPTPPWATRALYEYVVPYLKTEAPRTSILDPAAGYGHMSRVFEEYGHKRVLATDVVPYENIGVRDFITVPPPIALGNPDFIVTNPPYKYVREFIIQALQETAKGVGMLCRIQVLESQKRYEHIFDRIPPTQIAFFSDRIPFKSGVVVRKAPKMYFHIWLWWDDREPQPPIWIPPNAQQLLEKDSDYE